jgi:hypothetical protein
MTRPRSNPPRDETPASRGPFPFPTSEHHDAPPATALPPAEEPTEDALDHGIEESFPASDPVSVSVTKAEPNKPAAKDGEGRD